MGVDVAHGLGWGSGGSNPCVGRSGDHTFLQRRHVCSFLEKLKYAQFFEVSHRAPQASIDLVTGSGATRRPAFLIAEKGAPS